MPPGCHMFFILLLLFRPEPDGECRLSQEDLGSFAVDVAKALHYLSGHSLVHRDVAARNVLGKAVELTNGSDCGLCILAVCFL